MCMLINTKLDYTTARDLDMLDFYEVITKHFKYYPSTLGWGGEYVFPHRAWNKFCQEKKISLFFFKFYQNFLLKSSQIQIVIFFLLYLRSRYIFIVKCVFSRILTRNIFRFKVNKWHISQTKQTTKYFFNSTYFVDNLPVNQSILVWNLQKRKFN